MAQNTALLGVVGSTFASPKQFTAQSPSFGQYWATSCVINYGDASTLNPAPVAGTGNGIVPTGYVDVQFHVHNQWTTGRLYTNQSGSTMFGLFG